MCSKNAVGNFLDSPEIYLQTPFLLDTVLCKMTIVNFGNTDHIFMF